jgi:hypothetical protein
MSKNGVLVRLTEERWAHIIEQHGELDGMKREMLDAIAEPERVPPVRRERCPRFEQLRSTNGWLLCIVNCGTTVLSSLPF